MSNTFEVQAGDAPPHDTLLTPLFNVDFSSTQIRKAETRNTIYGPVGERGHVRF